jgi:hypothetical protein
MAEVSQSMAATVAAASSPQDRKSVRVRVERVRERASEWADAVVSVELVQFDLVG